MASSGTQGQETERGARELYELKQRAAKYYSENGVPKKMEEILNSMFYANPDDVYGHLANFFETYAKKPTITKLNAREGYDSKGQPTLQTEVFCTVKNKTQLSSTLVSATPNSHLLDNAKTEDREADDLERQESVTAAIKFMNSDLNNRLSGLDPSQQKDIDDVVSKFYEEMRAAEEERLLKEEEQSVEGGSPRLAKDVETASQSSADKKSKGAKGKDPKKKGKSAASVILPMEPKEKFLPGCGAVCAASQSACIAAAHVQNIPLYEHVANLRHGENPSKLFVPLPMVTIIQGGRAAPGKQNCVKEFMVVPKPGMPLSQSLPLIQKIYAYVGKSFFNKGGMTAKLVSDIGAYSPQFDRPEQGLDLLQEAITACEMTVGQDFFLAINCAAHEIFDYDPSAMKEPQAAFPGQDMHKTDPEDKEKGKYELIQGQQKVPEDVVEFWAELIGRYPSVIAIIDPLKRSDKEHWMRLSDKISSSCLLIGSHAHDRPGVLKNEEINPDFRTSGIAVKFERINTVSDVLDVVKKMEEDGNQIVVSSGLGETPDNFISDFAVGVSAKFITVGAPVRGERTSQLNRLLQIENLLEMAGKLGTHKAHTFPHIAPPPLPETEEGEEEGSKKQEPTAKKK